MKPFVMYESLLARGAGAGAGAKGAETGQHFQPPPRLRLDLREMFTIVA